MIATPDTRTFSSMPLLEELLGLSPDPLMAFYRTLDNAGRSRLREWTADVASVISAGWADVGARRPEFSTPRGTAYDEPTDLPADEYAAEIVLALIYEWGLDEATCVEFLWGERP